MGDGRTPDAVPTEHAQSRVRLRRGLAVPPAPRGGRGRPESPLKTHYGEVPGAELSPGGEAGASPGLGPPAAPGPRGFNGHSGHADPREPETCVAASVCLELTGCPRVPPGDDLLGALCLSRLWFPASPVMGEVKASPV